MSESVQTSRREQLEAKRTSLALRVEELREIVDASPERESNARDAVVRAEVEGDAKEKSDAEKALARVRKSADAAQSEAEESLKRIANIDIAIAEELQRERQEKLAAARKRSEEYRAQEADARYSGSYADRRAPVSAGLHLPRQQPNRVATPNTGRCTRPQLVTSRRGLLCCQRPTGSVRVEAGC